MQHVPPAVQLEQVTTELGKQFTFIYHLLTVFGNLVRYQSVFMLLWIELIEEGVHRSNNDHLTKIQISEQCFDTHSLLKH